MFIRKRTRQTKKYGESTTYQLIENYREDGKVKQKIICGLGRFDNVDDAVSNTKRILDIFVRHSERRNVRKRLKVSYTERKIITLRKQLDKLLEAECSVRNSTPPR